MKDKKNKFYLLRLHNYYKDYVLCSKEITVKDVESNVKYNSPPYFVDEDLFGIKLEIGEQVEISFELKQIKKI